MATCDFFWKLFAQTGSINAYLAYRRTHAAPSPS
ncbi:MAG TPA: YqzL family protein [Candidatus Dormibacteraeota bacterium]|nr:YqzL family protein [Candidatus Dormibacteraeota bacterium]